MKITIIFVVALLFVLGILIPTSESYGYRSGNSESKVLLRDVQVLTLKSGEMTKARRSSPIKQMELIGGSAKKEFDLHPNTIQCYNMGSNGEDVQWRCEATLDSSVKLGKIDVSCEGFGYPEDPYITTGSCGVFYELEYTNAARRKAALDEEGSGMFSFIIWVAVIVFIIYAVSNWCNGSPQQHGGDPNAGTNYNTATDNSYPPGGGYPGGGAGHPGGFNGGNGGGYQGYPNLNNNYPTGGGGCQPNINAGGAGGYGNWFSGLTGAGIGYLFGRNHSNRNNYYRSSPSYYSGGSTRSSYSSSGSGSGISSTSSSFSGTSRR